MKAIFVKDFANKKEGTVVEMNTALFADLQREGIVEKYDPSKLKPAPEVKIVKKETNPKVAKKVKR